MNYHNQPNNTKAPASKEALKEVVPIHTMQKQKTGRNEESIPQNWKKWYSEQLLADLFLYLSITNRPFWVQHRENLFCKLPQPFCTQSLLDSYLDIQ